MRRVHGPLLVAAVGGNALLGIVSLLFGLLAALAAFAAAIDLANLTWAGVGRLVADQLGADAVAALSSFGIDPVALVTEAAAQAGLVEPGLIARAVLAGLFVGLALFIESGVVALIAAHALWHASPARPPRLLALNAARLLALGLFGLAIAGAPQPIFGAWVVVGGTTLLSLDIGRRSARRAERER